MLCKPSTHVCLLLVAFGLAGCFDSRRDPCRLLTVQEMKSIDNTVTVSLWAGRDGERKDDEVCAFYAADGDPRAMLFVWYDKKKDPEELAKMAAAETNGLVVELPRAGSKAVAYFQGKELKFLAAKTSQGVIGLRAKQSVKRDSAELDQFVLLTERALSRNQ